MKTALIALILMLTGIQTYALSSTSSQPTIHFANAQAEKAFYRYKKNSHDGHKQLESALQRLTGRSTDTVAGGQYIAVDSTTLSYSNGRGGDDNSPQADQDFDSEVYTTNTAGVWDTIGIKTQTFNANNNILTTIIDELGNNPLNQNIQYVYTYSASGLYDSTETNYEWGGSAWVPTSGDIYQYDTVGNLLSDISLNGSSLDYYDKTIYSYNAQGQLTTILRQYYNSGAWTNSYLTTYAYDGSGNNISQEVQQWAVPAWQAYEYYYYTYDGTNDQLTSLLLRFNTTTLVYDSARLITMTYNSPGQMYDSLSQAYANPGWANTSIAWFQYDQYGNRDNITSQRWNTSTNTWGVARDYQKAIDFNSVGQYQSMSQYTWETATSTWLNTYDYHWWYSGYYPSGIDEIKTITSSVYPNPFTRSFTVAFDAESAGAATLKLYDMDGRLITRTVTNAKSGANIMTWDAGYTLPAGVYIYELSLGNAISRGKLIAQ